MDGFCTKRNNVNQETHTSQSAAAAVHQVSERGAKLVDGEDGGEIFLPYPDTPGDLKYVDFDVRLEDDCGRYFLKNVRESGLAFSAGFRTGDVLIGVNGTNIEGRGVEFLLNLFRNLGQPQLLLEVKRSLREEMIVFIWTIFRVVITDGVPGIEVLQTVENDEDVMPFINIGKAFTWLGPPADPYDIYIDGDPQLYLSIKEEGLTFGKYGPDSQFYRYNYSGHVEPDRGVIVAYSLQPLGKLNRSPEKNTPAGTASNTLKVMDFPMYMHTQYEEIRENPRFWLEKTYEDGFSLESLEAKNMYLGKGEDNKAILSKERTELMTSFSSTPGIIQSVGGASEATP